MIGDLNIDGFADIFMTLKLHNKKTDKDTHASLILMNVLCKTCNSTDNTELWMD